MPDVNNYVEIRVAIGSVSGGLYFVAVDRSVVGQFSVPNSTGASGAFSKGKSLRLHVAVGKTGKYRIIDASGNDVTANFMLQAVQKAAKIGNKRT